MIPEEFQARLEKLRPGCSFSWTGTDFKNFEVLTPNIKKPTWDELMSIELSIEELENQNSKFTKPIIEETLEEKVNRLEEKIKQLESKIKEEV
jgi:hypothetical protein